jgi:hypothetical protein
MRRHKFRLSTNYSSVDDRPEAEEEELAGL